MPPTSCPCGRTLIPQRTWAQATPTQRQAWLNQGANLYQGRGLCRACYQRLYRTGTIPPRAPTTSTPIRKGPCLRCGITTTGTLCRDCRDL